MNKSQEIRKDCIFGRLECLLIRDRTQFSSTTVGHAILRSSSKICEVESSVRDSGQSSSGSARNDVSDHHVVFRLRSDGKNPEKQGLQD